ncbi:peptidylprolyl isomerase [Glycomyces salinus]|uniref:peptidylprolyl isomerase n=1 Tax=Glycomyces salinus TaxID=980294 RepID=UPI0018EDEE61|nr:peptidylprolyl isomerase [Glycomyces salinus]
MEPRDARTETEYEPVAANPYKGTPPWQRRGGWKAGLAGLAALVLTAGSIVGVAWLAFRDGGDRADGGEQVISERCQVVESDDAGPEADPPGGGAPADRTVVSIETSHGTLDVMLWGDLAPCGVEAFLQLAQSGYYNTHDCDRLTTQETSPWVILQCGRPGWEPDNDLTYGPGWRYQTEVGMEGNDVQDVLALVTDETGRAGSAFTLIRGQAVPTANVSVIGGIVDGFEVLDALAWVPDQSTYDGQPPESITIYGITVIDESDLPTGDGPTSPGAGDQTTVPTPTDEATDTPTTDEPS